MINKYFSRKKLFAIILLSIIMVVSICMLSINTNKAKADYRVVEEYKQEYFEGDFLEVKSAYVTVDGTEYEMDSTVCFPNNTKSSEKLILLNVIGNTKVLYSKTVGGVNYFFEKSFNVKETHKTLFNNINGAEFYNNGQTPEYFESAYNGLKVTVSGTNSEFEYSSIINLNDNNKEKAFIKMMCIPDIQGIPELDEFYLKLTDIYDQSNYIEIYIYNGLRWIEPHLTYFAATISNKFEHLGWARGWDRVNEVEYDSLGTTGTGAKHAFGGVEGTSAQPFELYYAPDELCFYAGRDGKGLLRKILDLDDPNEVGQSNVWSGFSSNEVKLSIRIPKIQASKASFLITEIDGIKLSGKIENKFAPTISVNFEGYKENNLPYGVAGENTFYPIFDAIAYTPYDGKIYSPKISVVSPNGELLPIYNDKFPTKEAGTYKLVYSSESYLSFTSERTVEILVKDTVDDSDKLSMNFNYYVDKEKDVDSAFVGQVIEFDEIGFAGGIGKVNTQVSLYYGETVAGINEQENLLLNNKYIFVKKGYYKVVASATDIVGNYVEEVYVINTEYNDLPMIDDVVVPSYIVKGDKIKLNVPKASFYSETFSDSNVEVKVFVDEGNGYVDYSSNPIFIPQVVGNVKVLYKAVSLVDDSKYSEKEYTIKVGEVIEDSQMTGLKGYFYAPNYTVSASYDGLMFTTSDNLSPSGEAEIVFGRELYADSFNINFNTIKDKANFGSINIILSDTVNPEKIVNLQLSHTAIGGNDRVELSINGVYSSMFNASLKGNSSNPISLTLDNKTGELFDYEGQLLGNIGIFDTKYLNLAIQLKGVTGESCLNLVEINGQYFSAIQNDITGPKVYFDRDFNNWENHNIMDEITAPKAFAIDVLSPDAVCSMKVVGPDNTVMYSGSSENGFTFVGSAYGRYTVTYTSVDKIGNQGQSRTISYYIVDREKPELLLSGLIPEDVAVGTTFDIPNVKVVDNVDGEIPYSIVVTDTRGYTYKLTEKSIAFSNIGVYIVSFYAVDNSGNFMISSYYVNVK